jgi:acyl-CoA synthetase (NDP forming)
VSFSHAQLERAFNPRVIAVIGDKQMNGFMWLRALQQFSGKLYSVQIDPNEIPAIEAMGVTNVRSLLDIPEAVDYVVVAVPRNVAPHVLADCVRKQVGAATLFTAGFSETGDPEGVRLEQEIATLARDANLLLVGPNCMGIANLRIGMCNFPNQPVGEAAAGRVGFIGQSGTHTITFCMRAPAEGVGVSKAVSIGNAVVADASDYLEYLRDDPDTAVIAAYIEGVRDGRRFFDVLCQTTATKPVILWKGGVSEAGQRAIFSHTAALATRAAVWRGMVRQADAIAVDSQDALLDVARTLLTGKTANGLRAGLIAMTGGPSVVMTDAFTQAGLEVPLLTDASYAKLREFFQMVGGSLRNPLDAGSTIAMGFRSDNLTRLLDVLDRDATIDVVAIDLGAALSIDRYREHPELAAAMTDVLVAFAQRSSKPFAVVADAPHRLIDAERLRDGLRRRGVLTFVSPLRAAHALRASVEYWRMKRDGSRVLGVG